MIRYFIVIIIFSLTLASLNSCKTCNNYIVTNEYIQNNSRFEHPFYFEKIKVDSIDTNGIPIKYEVTRKASVSLKRQDLKPERKIYFYEDTQNYEWHDITNATLHPTLPIDMIPGNWYLIRGLKTDFTTSAKKIFIHVTESGEFQVFHPRIINN